MKIRNRKGMLVITVPLINPPRKSKSGKTLLAASSSGPRRTKLRVNDKPVIAIVTAYVRPDGYVKRTRIARRKKSSKPQRVSQRRQMGPTAQAKHRRR
jgi:hypothetical protein